MAGKKTYDPPDSPNSVGWTEAKSIRLATKEEPFILEAGGSIGPVDVAYETYGELSSGKDNVILVEHALSGDAHVAGWDKKSYYSGERQWLSRKPGWWDSIVGPGKAIDTEKFFVICSNYLGSCYGTTGPSSINPATGKPYGLTFPMVTVHDWVRLQSLLLEKLGIEKIYAVTGGSLGGQQAIEWALAYPERVKKTIVFAASPRLSSQGLAFNAVGRYCIMNDPNFNGGNYYGSNYPQAGLAAARMLAHITYLSRQGMDEKFGRRLRNKEKPDFSFNIEFEVESYLEYQGRSFVERFDANSYLYITKAMDYYDGAAKWGDGDLAAACGRIKSDVMIVSFSSDWLYPPAQCNEFALALSEAGKPVASVNVPSLYGHDAFLVETQEVGTLLSGFL
jgi:homoserine O-acetyltransferase/O-succinyltransferase